MSNIFSAGGTTVSIYPTPQSLGNKIDEYFDYCFVIRVDQKTGIEKAFEVHTPTYSGLARYLGFSSRRQLLDYCNKDERYTEVIRRGCLRLEDYLEGKLVYSKAPTGIMFALKNNAGWEEKTKQQIMGDGDQPLVFGWSDNAKDIIDATARAVKPAVKEGVLPPPTPKIEGTVKYDSSDGQ